MRKSACDVVIIGLGPTGIGAALRLAESGVAVRAFDASPTPGGMATSAITPAGFLYDVGSHVIHNHYPEFDAVLASLNLHWNQVIPARGTNWNGTFLPFPAQRNFNLLPAEARAACLRGLELAQASQNTIPPEATLETFLLATLGEGLTRLVIGPLNVKQWSTPLHEVSSSWARHRSGSGHANIPLIDVNEIRSRIPNGQAVQGWDATTTFPYPARGGVGSIWSALARRIPADQAQFGTSVVHIDPKTQVLTTSTGESIHYQSMISTIPIDRLLGLMAGRDDLQMLAGQFRRACSYLVGIGFAGRIPTHLAGLCSILFPGPEVPFWRVSFPANFSPGNVPDPENTWSVLVESSLAPELTSPGENAFAAVMAGLVRAGIIPAEAKPVDVWSRFLPYGYPVPWLGRDELLNRVQPALRELNILSRGRFGGWKYEVSNMDHAYMQGVEAADHLTLGTHEPTYFNPLIINS